VSDIAACIEYDKRPRKRAFAGNYFSCQCKECGSLLETLTNVHAAKHGMTKQEMIDKGLVKVFNHKKRKAV
jgi:hypothetical protein